MLGLSEREIRGAMRVYWALWRISRHGRIFRGSERRIAAWAARSNLRGLSLRTLERYLPRLKDVGAILCREVRERVPRAGSWRWKTDASIYVVARTAEEMEAWTRLRNKAGRFLSKFLRLSTFFQFIRSPEAGRILIGRLRERYWPREGLEVPLAGLEAERLFLSSNGLRAWAASYG